MPSILAFASPVSFAASKTLQGKGVLSPTRRNHPVSASISVSTYRRDQGREPKCGKTFCADLAGFGAPRTGAMEFAAIATKTIFGNAHLYEEDLSDLAPVFSEFSRTGDVRELVARIGKSETFRKHFFDPNSSVRFVEICFKAFLGRGPASQKEVSEKIQKLADCRVSYEEFIDSFVESEEYEQKFGPALLPTFESPGGLYRNGMVGFMSNMKVNITTRGGNTDATPISSMSQAVLAARESAPSQIVAAGHGNLLPQYTGFSVAKVDSIFKRDYADVLIPSKAASNWAGIAGALRENIPVEEDWAPGWNPDAKESWSPGWAPQTKRYV